MSPKNAAMAKVTSKVICCRRGMIGTYMNDRWTRKECGSRPATQAFNMVWRCYSIPDVDGETGVCWNSMSFYAEYLEKHRRRCKCMQDLSDAAGVLEEVTKVAYQGIV